MSWRDHPAVPLAALVASLAGGFAGARLGERDPSTAPVVAPPAAWRAPAGVTERCLTAPPAPVPGLDEADRRALLAQISAAVAAELRGAAGRAPPAPPSPAAVAAGADATQLLERALRAGEWTDGDSEAAQRLMPSLEPEDAGALMRGWAAAVNRGDLKVRSRGPPL